MANFRINDTNDINYTQIFFRFLKNKGAYSGFFHGLYTRDTGKQLLGAFYALANNKKASVSPHFPFKDSTTFINDPIKWLYYNNEKSERDYFLYDLVNYHIYWADTQEGHKFWEDIHREWKKYLNSILIHHYKTENAAREINSIQKEEELEVKFFDLLSNKKEYLISILINIIILISLLRFFLI